MYISCRGVGQVVGGRVSRRCTSAEHVVAMLGSDVEHAATQPGAGVYDPPPVPGYFTGRGIQRGARGGSGRTNDRVRSHKEGADGMLVENRGRRPLCPEFQKGNCQLVDGWCPINWNYVQVREMFRSKTWSTGGRRMSKCQEQRC